MLLRRAADLARTRTRGSRPSTPARPRRAPGVTAVHVISPAGHGNPVGRHGNRRRGRRHRGARRATRVRKIKVEYEVLPHLVREEDLAKAGRARQSRRRAGHRRSRQGLPGSRSRSREGDYGIPVLTHCCLEPHGGVIAWKGDKVDYWPTTQNVSGIAGDARAEAQGAGGQHPRAPGAHGRRLRQQVLGGPLGRRLRPSSRRRAAARR